jgi:magnesium chelatase subunit D
MMSETMLAITDPLVRGLACAALEPGLRRVLLFDTGFEALETAVPLFQSMLQTTTGTAVTVVALPANALDDDLWGSLTPKLSPSGAESARTSGLAVQWQEGLLTRNRHAADLLLVVIPDLSRLSLAAVRTCIMLLDTPVAQLQRHGQDDTWRPQLSWLAACDRERVGRVSTHLLDRFALRLSAPAQKRRHTPANIHAWLEAVKRPLPQLTATEGNQLPVAITDALQKATSQEPTLTAAAVERILAYLETPAAGVRRELALARLSQAQARLGMASDVQVEHVDAAAKLIGLAMPVPEAEPPAPPPVPDPHNDPDPLQPGWQDERSSFADDPVPQPAQTDPGPPVDPGAPETLAPSPLPDSPYPEDTAPIERELFALRMPLRRYKTAAIARGAVIGVQPAESLHDLALLPTVLEAALYKEIRQKKQKGGNGRFQIHATDLRCYRRSPAAEQMLLLLLDYTSLRDCEWQEALLPHLRWAYVNRATVAIIQVGHADTVDELRAQRVTGNSILTPRIGEALEARPGRATPLAHGLDVAYQMLQQAQEHGRVLIQHTRFVVITDGRGNVPLAASHSGQVQMPVNREGIEDALQLAREFRKLKRVLPIVLDPQPAYHAELPAELAEALGAVHEIILLVEEAQLV